MNSRFLIAILILLQLFLVFLAKELLETDDVYFNSLSENLTVEQIENLLAFRSYWGWIFYLFIPIVILIKISIISFILDVGCFFFGKEIKYKRLFSIVVKAEYIFLFVIIFKSAWFYFFKTDYTLEDLQYFYPFSALNIVGYSDLQPWFIYPFQVLNLFEIVYWYILAYQIDKEINENTDKGLSIVLSSYGVGLLIWVVGVMFFTLNIS